MIVAPPSSAATPEGLRATTDLPHHKAEVGSTKSSYLGNDDNSNSINNGNCNNNFNNCAPEELQYSYGEATLSNEKKPNGKEKKPALTKGDHGESSSSVSTQSTTASEDSWSTTTTLNSNRDMDIDDKETDTSLFELPVVRVVSSCSPINNNNNNNNNNKPLKSALKSGRTQNKYKKHTGGGARRVRGLWNENSLDPFAQLRDETLRSIISFLPMGDICVLSGVSKRWRQFTLLPWQWRHVDASEFVARVFAIQQRRRALENAPAAVISKKTAEVLTNRLQQLPSPESLTIRSIRHQLLAEDYLPSIQGILELTLSEFFNLCDTHVHVMLLSSAVIGARPKGNTIRKLALEDCPLLTNASVQSIASQCSLLEDLSLRGCKNISKVMPLQDLFKVKLDEDHPLVEHVSSGLFDSSRSTASMQSLFAPPQLTTPVTTPATSQLASLFAPPPSTPEPNSATLGLASLFAPPLPVAVPAPPPPPAIKKTGLGSLFERPRERPRERSRSSSFALPDGNLSRLNLSYTSVTASALVLALQAAPGCVVLESLEMRGCGESWTDAALEQVQSCPFKVLDIGCANIKSGSKSVTDKGMQALAATEFEELCLSGQKGIKMGFLTAILSTADKLRSLDLMGCTSLFGGGDKLSFASMVFALQKASNLEYLSVSRCFSDESKAGSSAHVLKADEERGRLFLDAICSSASRLTLRELDLSWCWFVTAMEVAKIRRSCPKLDRLHLLGTRCNQVL